MTAEAALELSAAIHVWKLHTRTLINAKNNIDDVIRLSHEVVDLRESIDRSFARAEADAERRHKLVLARVEEAIKLRS